jgi:hypothetical protein
MIESRWLDHTLKTLEKLIDQKIRNQNRFRPSKEPIYTIKSTVYKGVPIYIIVYKSKDCHVIFNTSPVDAGYVEFIRVINLTYAAAVIYTQHFLDRYNERIHHDKYENHRDLIKRFMVNSHPMGDAINIDNKFVTRVHEGFVSGTYEPIHKNFMVNTFYDNEEFMDNKRQQMARGLYGFLNSLTPTQLTIYRVLFNQFEKGAITNDEFILELIAHKIYLP